MEENKYINRWKLLLEVVNSMVKGDFSKQISSSDQENLIGELIEIFKMRLQEVEADLNRLALIHTDKTYLILTEITITLDDTFRIIKATPPAADLLGIPLSDLKDKPFKSLLIPYCINYWEEIEQTLKAGKWKRGRVELTIKRGLGLEMPLHGTIAPLGPGEPISYVFNSHKTFIYEEDYSELLVWAETLHLPNATIKSADVRLAEQVRDEIKVRLHDGKLDLDHLALKLGTTRTRIIKAFKDQFELTPHQYYREERLLRAKGLLEIPEMTFKHIALSLGFSNYSNFVEQIKKRFKKTPREIRASANNRKA